MVSQNRLEGPDVFARTFAADEKSLLAIAARLEARAEHGFFHQVVGEYLSELGPSGSDRFATSVAVRGYRPNDRNSGRMHWTSNRN
jgi:hypothetical protein